jgi:hypothetical protein
MREPPLHIRVLGHPVIAMPMTGAGLFTLYAWTQHPGMDVFAVAAVTLLIVLGKAVEHRMSYVRWRKAWDAMADCGAAKPKAPFLAKLALAVIVPAGFIAHDSGALHGLAGPATGLGLLGLILLAGTMTVRWWRRRHSRARPSSRSDVVSVCVTKGMAVPSLDDAYARLPAHSRHVLSAGSDLCNR